MNQIKSTLYSDHSSQLRVDHLRHIHCISTSKHHMHPDKQKKSHFLQTMKATKNFTEKTNTLAQETDH